MKRITVALAVLACGPAVAGLLDQTPTDSATLRGTPAALSACAYVKLDASQGTGIKKVDLPGSAILALEGGGVRYWQLTFTATGPSTTRVDLSQAATMWGPLGGKDIMPTVRSCAG